ncbi:MAG: cytochrome c-type biogenesis CcmF C-terminal domain-containing protein [Coxiellaceae bacterium]|nr:cytochrome c-type biogenesis CcmF C-terminal domain-containing protein [Coxiellaceae bacterium]
MITEIAHFCFILALCIAVVQAVLPMVGASKGNIALMRVGRYASMAQLLLIAVSLCGAHQASMLLWVFLLTLWMVAVSQFSKRLPAEMLARTLAVLSWIATGFYLLLLMTSNPFAHLLPSSPINLQLLMLYMGYVGFSVVFAFVMAALISNRLDAVWARWVRPWTTVAWCFLTYSIVFGGLRLSGSVESAPLLPWLMATALLHALSATEKRGVFKAWTVLLAISTFVLCLASTLQGYALIFLFVVLGAALALYAMRSRRLISHTGFSWYSREMMLLFNNIFLAAVMITILLAAIFPSLLAGRYYMIFIALVAPLLFLVGIAPYFKWQHTSLIGITYRTMFGITVAVVLAGITALLIGYGFKPSVILGLGLAFWILMQTLNQWLHFNSQRRILFRRLARSQWAMVLAHCGVALMVVGITLGGNALATHLNAWVKFGGLFMLLGGLMAVFDRRYRVRESHPEKVLMVNKLLPNESVSDGK